MKAYVALTQDQVQEIRDLKYEREFLQDQIKELRYCTKLYENELRRRMTPAEFAEFMRDCAHDLFKRSVEDMEECEFKNFCKDLIARWKA